MSHATFCRSRGDEAFPCCLDCGSAYSVTSFRAANVMFGATLFWREAAAKRLVITVVQTSESNSVVPSRCPASQRHHVATSRSPRMLTFLTQVPAITNSNLQSLFPTSPRRHVTPSLPQKCRLFFCKSLQSSFSPSQPLAFTIFTLKKSAPGSHTQLSTLNQKFQSTFHHQRPVFTTCLHFFTYSRAPFRFPVTPTFPFPKNTSVYIKTHCPSLSSALFVPSAVDLQIDRDRPQIVDHQEQSTSDRFLKLQSVPPSRGPRFSVLSVPPWSLFLDKPHHRPPAFVEGEF